MIKKKIVVDKNIVTLMVGTGISQVLPFAISPLLTRLFSPEDFGFFSIFMSIVSLLSVIITAKYEMAIMIPADEKESSFLVDISVIFTHFITLITLILVVFFGSKINKLFDLDTNKVWLYFIPLSLFFTGIQQTFNYRENRHGNYKRIAYSRVIKSLVTSIISIVLGYFLFNKLGLIIGYCLGTFVSAFFLDRNYILKLYLGKHKFEKIKLIEVAKKNNSFPKFMIPAHLLNTLSSTIQPLFIVKFFSITLAGYFSFINRVVGGPMSIITSSFGDVFREKASKQYNVTGNCHSLYLQTFKKLTLIAVIPFTIFAFTAPFLFKIVFGNEWEIAGEYAQIMTIMFFLQFIVNPLASVVIIAGKQKLDLFWQIILFILIVTSILFGKYFNDFKLTIILVTMSYSIMYIFSFIISYHYSKPIR